MVSELWVVGFYAGLYDDQYDDALAVFDTKDAAESFLARAQAEENALGKDKYEARTYYVTVPLPLNPQNIEDIAYED